MFDVLDTRYVCVDKLESALESLSSFQLFQKSPYEEFFPLHRLKVIVSLNWGKTQILFFACILGLLNAQAKCKLYLRDGSA